MEHLSPSLSLELGVVRTVRTAFADFPGLPCESAVHDDDDNGNGGSAASAAQCPAAHRCVSAQTVQQLCQLKLLRFVLLQLNFW